MPEQTAVERALANFWRDFDQATRRTAARLGRPPDTKQLGDAEKVRLWGRTDPKVDQARLASQLLTTGLPPELLDKAAPGHLAVVDEAPELAALYAQPTDDPDLATALAALAHYPYTHALLKGLDMPEEQVSEAERLQRLWEKQHGGLEGSEATEEAAPDGARPRIQGESGDISYTQPGRDDRPPGPLPAPTAPPTEPMGG